MKKILTTAMALCMALAAHAQSTTEVNSNASAGASNAGVNNSTIVEASTIPTETTVNQKVSGSQTLRNTPSVSGPPLTSSNDTCMGSASGSVNAPGIGVSLGKTYTDGNCVMLKNSRELWNMGMKAAAMALMCTDKANREALELTGYECPQTTRDKKSIAAGEPTDPYVRDRMGLAPLTK